LLSTFGFSILRTGNSKMTLTPAPDVLTMPCFVYWTQVFWGAGSQF
jgi:hypothetical protein